MRSNGPRPARAATASPVITSTLGSPAKSSLAPAARSGSSSAVSSWQPAGIALVSQAVPMPVAVPSSAIDWHPAASTARNRPVPGRQAEARQGPASSRVSGKPAERASCSACLTRSGTITGDRESLELYDAVAGLDAAEAGFEGRARLTHDPVPGDRAGELGA